MIFIQKVVHFLQVFQFCRVQVFENMCWWFFVFLPCLLLCPPFLIFLILVLSFCFLVSLNKDLSILLIFSKNKFFVLFVYFYFVDFSSQFDYFLLLGEFASFCFKVVKCSFNSLVWNFPDSLCTHLVLWTFLLTLFSLCQTNLGVLCGHFHWILRGF